MECKLQTINVVDPYVSLAGLFLALILAPPQVTSLSYHAESGTIAAGLAGHVEMWQTAPFKALPAHVCVRERLAEAQAQANGIQASLDKAYSGLRQQMSRDLTKLMERHNELLGIIHVCTQTLDSLTDCLYVSGLEDLRGAAFKEWLCDIGMSKLQTAFKDINGATLTMLNVDSVMEYDVTFNDAAALQLCGYVAHYKLSDDSAFAPPRDSVLSWDQVQTANWIKSLDPPYSSLASADWHGAALCSLSPSRVVEASKGALKAAEAVKFIGMVRAKRNETDGDKDEWVTKWTGLIPIENQA